MCAEQSCAVLRVYGPCRCMYSPPWTLHRSHKRELAAVGVDPLLHLPSIFSSNPLPTPRVLNIASKYNISPRCSPARDSLVEREGRDFPQLRRVIIISSHSRDPPSRGRTLRLSSHRKARTHPRREREKKNLISLMHLASPPPPPPISRRYSRFLLLAGSQPQQDERAKNWFTRRRPQSGC